MASLLLLRTLPLLRHRLINHHSRLTVSGILSRRWRLWCSVAESANPDEDVSSAVAAPATVVTVTEPPRLVRGEDTDYRKWKDVEEEILQDIEPITCLAKEILHSDRYMDGERLSADDEKAVAQKLLAYHPHSEDKIGCGLDFIMVDRHPLFRHSRCLFVVRTDGGWIDFSYQKCLRAYIRDKYPSYAERFIREHFKRGSG